MPEAHPGIKRSFIPIDRAIDTLTLPQQMLQASKP
jgi:hypothetical protein